MMIRAEKIRMEEVIERKKPRMEHQFLEELLRQKAEIEGTAPADSKKETALWVLMFIIGACLLLYPSISNYINSLRQTQAVMHYADEVARMTDEEHERCLQMARDFNQKMAKRKTQWDMLHEETSAEYESLLNFAGTGVMGYIDIPKINVQLPIYHGTSESVLQGSIGHIEHTSLPVGGPGTHCVLSGHRGLPSAKLFSDLDLMAENDTFTLSILNETYTYEVDQIRTVLPEDTSFLEVVPGKDYCTLVTCTPYRINTHRMLVRGHRVKNANGPARLTADALLLKPAFVAPFIMIPIIIGLLMTLFL